MRSFEEPRQVNALPDPPSNPSPAPGAAGVSLHPDLCVSVTDPDGGSLTATFYGREFTGAAADDFTIIALPDTQFYSANFPATYSAQTQWIVDNRVSRNIAFVTQLGDCVDDATVNQQFVNADAAWDIIEGNPYSGQSWGIPYGIAVGNHDQTPVGDPGTLASDGSTTTGFNSWFGVARYTGRGYYGGHYGTNNDNHYELFSASGMDFIAVHIEYMPSDSTLRQSVLAWVNEVLQTYSNRRAMVISHYLLETGASTAFGDQGQATYDALKANANLFLMMAGHRDQASRRSDTFNGHTVTTMKSDYQTLQNGGNGWLRILTFSPRNSEIHVETYSPTLGQFINGHPDNLAGTPQNDFVLSYAMDDGRPFVMLGSDVRPSGGTACVPWPGREAGRRYEWYVTVGDGSGTTTGNRNSFTTTATCTQSSDCDDADSCTTDTCVDGNVSALQFDGTNDYVTMGAAAGTGALGAATFTIETWFKRTGTGVPVGTGTGGIPSLIPLVSKGAAQNDTPANVNANYIFGINTAGNVLAADFEDTSTGLNHPVSGTTTIVNGRWYHAAATYDGTTWRLYLNGNLEATLLVGAFTPQSASIQHFGLGTTLTSTGSAAGFFAGLLDEARVWNAARPLAQIQAAMNRGVTSGTGLIGRWGLDEGGGLAANDSTTPAENGALNNSAIPATSWSAADKAPLRTCSRAPIAGCCTTGAPGEPTNLRFESDHATFTWGAAAGDGPGTVHQVVRGVIGELPVGSAPSEVCLGPSIAGATATDSTAPSSGQSYWYLIRGSNSCGAGTYGWAASHGVPTAQRTTAACP